MWLKIAKGVLKYRWACTILLILFTSFMAFEASKVKMSYDFSRAIPTDHPKYLQYLDFKKTFGEDGNLLTIGFQTDSMFQLDKFNAAFAFQQSLKKINGVEDIISVQSAVTLKRNDSTSKLDAQRIFPSQITSQLQLDSLKNIFYHCRFTRGSFTMQKTRHIYLVSGSTKKYWVQRQERKQWVRSKKFQKYFHSNLDLIFT